MIFNHMISKKFLIILLVMLVIGIGASAFFISTRQPSPAQQTAPSPTATLPMTTPTPTNTHFPSKQAPTSSPVDETNNWKTYRNDQYGFEFRYPSDYLFEMTKDYKGSDWLFELTSPTKEILIISLRDNRSPELDTFEKFALHMSEVYCSADGPDGSVYCANENKKSEFTNPAGIIGYEIYLNETTENYTTNQKTTRIKGPIFVLDFSPLNNSDARGVFLNGEDTFSEREMIVQIISTFKFTR